MLPGEHISVSHIGLCEIMLEAISQPQLHSLAPTFSTEVIILWLQRHYFANKGPSSQGYGFSVVMYGCESWTVKKAEHQRIDAFELWCWRWLLRVPGLQGSPTSPS